VNERESKANVSIGSVICVLPNVQWAGSVVSLIELLSNRSNSACFSSTIDDDDEDDDVDDDDDDDDVDGSRIVDDVDVSELDDDDVDDVVVGVGVVLASSNTSNDGALSSLDAVFR
jgi:hypothetical protein